MVDGCTLVFLVETQHVVSAVLLYVISETETGPCKIGFADRVYHRLKCLQSGNPRRLTLEFETECANYRMAEKIAHHRAGHKNNVLGEWFNITPEAAIIAVKVACQLAIESQARRAALDEAAS